MQKTPYKKLKSAPHHLQVPKMPGKWHTSFTIVGIPVAIDADDDEYDTIKCLFQTFKSLHHDDTTIDLIPYVPETHDEIDRRCTDEQLELVRYAIGISTCQPMTFAETVSAFEKVRIFVREYSHIFEGAGFNLSEEPLVISAAEWGHVVDRIINDEEYTEDDDPYKTPSYIKKIETRST